MESGNLNFLETSGPLQACNGTALPFYVFEDERERAVIVTGSRDVHVLENFLGPELARHPVTEEKFI